MSTVGSLRPLVTTLVSPVRLVQTSTGRHFLDFGRAAFGTIQLTTSASTACDITVHLGEVLAADCEIHRTPGGSRRFRTMRLSLHPGTHTYRLQITPDQRNTNLAAGAILMPPDIGEVMPFRYCELEGLPEPLTLAAIQQLAVHYPFDDSASAFTSSSRVLNDVWDLCKYSIKATTFAGIYVDGDRERIPYEGDAYINQLGHYCVDREYALARHTAEYLLTHPTWPMEWHQHMPLIAWADYLYSGDDRFIRQHYDILAAKTLRGLAREDGLIVEDPAKMTEAFRRSIHLSREVMAVVDWPPRSFTRDQLYGERDDHDMLPVNSVPNAFYCHALMVMVWIAAVVRPEETASWIDLQACASARFNDVFWNPTTGRYIDGEGSTHSSLHSNLFPLAFNLVPPDRLRSVLTFIQSRGMACSVYAAQFLLEALYNAGEADYALSLLTATHDRSWAHMLYGLNSTITTEAWDNKYKENQDYNHAWGAAPANLIPRCLMGIQPVVGGFRVASIRPQLASLSFATLRTPTPLGPITLDIDQSQPGRFSATIELPDGMTAGFVVPPSHPTDITLEPPHQRKTPGQSRMEIGPGKTRITARR